MTRPRSRLLPALLTGAGLVVAVIIAQSLSLLPQFSNPVKEEEVDRSAPPLLLYGHLDKQPEMTGWREGLGPWTPVRDGDRDRLLYGRIPALRFGYVHLAELQGRTEGEHEEDQQEKHHVDQGCYIDGRDVLISGAPELHPCRP